MRRIVARLSITVKYEPAGTDLITKYQVIFFFLNKIIFSYTLAVLALFELL